MKQPTGERAALPREVWPLIVANGVIALGYGLIAPVLPQLARHFGVSIGAATFVITAFALMKLLAGPPTGLLVKRIGERSVYVTGVLIIATSTLACAFAQNYWQLVLFRSLAGIGSTMFFVSTLGLMIRMSPRDARGKVAGLFSGAFLTGSVAGPLLGSATIGLGLSAPFLIYGAALVIAAVVVTVSLRHSTLAAPAADDELAVTVRVALRHPAYRAVLLSNFATGWSVFGLRYALVPLFVTGVIDHKPGAAGIALAAFAVGNVAAVLPSGWLSDRVGRKPLMLIGLTLFGVFDVVRGLTTTLDPYLVAAVVAGAAAGVYTSAQQAVVADVIGRARGGTAIAVFQMMWDFGAIVGSLSVGLLAQDLSYEWAFAVSGAILLLAAAVWVFAPETRNEGIRLWR